MELVRQRVENIPEPGRGGGQQRAVREERKLGRLLSSSWPAASPGSACLPEESCCPAWSPPGCAPHQWDWFRGQAAACGRTGLSLLSQPITRAAPMLDTPPPALARQKLLGQNLGRVRERCHQTEADPSQDMQG